MSYMNRMKLGLEHPYCDKVIAALGAPAEAN